MKSIILCADDYGQNTAISQAIIELLKKKRLSAVSCMTTSAHWLPQAADLVPFKGAVDLGLHLNFTEGVPLSLAFATQEGAHFPHLSHLLLKSYLRQMDKTAILAEIHAQIDQFAVGLGCMPDFIDGHQHVHQLPVIRDLILAVYRARLRQHRCYIRCVYTNPAELRMNEEGYFKKLIIQLCGAAAFKKQLLREKIPHNSSFSGIYSFARGIDYSQFFPRFLQQVQAGGLIMCHPGLLNESPAKEDRIARARSIEYAYFNSEKFVQTLRVNNSYLSRLYQ